MAKISIISLVFLVVFLLTSCGDEKTFFKLSDKDGFYLEINSTGWWVCTDNKLSDRGRSSMKICESGIGYIYNEQNKTGYIISEDDTVFKFKFKLNKDESYDIYLYKYDLVENN